MMLVGDSGMMQETLLNSELDAFLMKFLAGLRGGSQVRSSFAGGTGAEQSRWQRQGIVTESGDVGLCISRTAQVQGSKALVLDTMQRLLPLKLVAAQLQTGATQEGVRGPQRFRLRHHRNAIFPPTQTSNWRRIDGTPQQSSAGVPTTAKIFLI